MKVRPIAYWMATAFIGLETFAGGYVDLTRGLESVVVGKPVADVVAQLGYPDYVLTILGLGKIPAAITVLVPGLPRLKEWAYASIVFEMTGAAASHVLRGNGAEDAAIPLVFLSVALISWALRPADRTLSVVR